MVTPRARPLARTLALFGSLAGLATCGEHGAPPAPEGACPYHTPAEWQAFVDRWAADPRWVQTCEDGYCDAGLREQVGAEVRRVFDQCQDLLAQRPALAACTANLRRFTPRWMEQHSPDSYGFTLANRAYFAAQEAPGEPPGMMLVPPELVLAIPDVARVTAACREHGWRWLVQTSCLGVVRLFVALPDPEGPFDRWMLLNLSAGDGGALAVDVDRTMSFLAVQKRDAAGAALPRVRLHFRDYTLTAAAPGGYRLTLDEATPTKCYACHPSGVRQLLPRRTASLDAAPVRGEPDAPSPGFGERRLRELNALLGSYGLPDWNGLVAVDDLGPPLGKDTGCTACHDGRTRGRLTAATSEAQLDEKVDHELAMPPEPALPLLLERSEMGDPPLDAPEEARLAEARRAHRALDAQVQGARAPALREWLGAVRCE